MTKRDVLEAVRLHLEEFKLLTCAHAIDGLIVFDGEDQTVHVMVTNGLTIHVTAYDNGCRNCETLTTVDAGQPDALELVVKVITDYKRWLESSLTSGLPC